MVREWVNGESFLYLGQSCRLALVAEQEADLLLKEGRFCLKRALIDHGGEGAARQALEAFYSAKGEQRIRERVAYFAPTV